MSRLQPAGSGAEDERVRRGRRVGDVPLTLTWLLLGAYVLALTRPGGQFWLLRDLGLGEACLALPVVLLLDVARRRTGAGRLEVLLVALGVLAWVAGDSYYVIDTWLGRTMSVPSFADVGYLLFPPCVLAALVVQVRREREREPGRPPVWLDSALGGLGAATGLAVLLSPVFRAASEDPTTAAVGLAYPLSDLVLVATLVAIVTARGLRPGRSWLWLTAGLLLFSSADVVYALRVEYGTYVVGTPLDALWIVGLTAIATGARQHRPRAAHTVPTTPTAQAAQTAHTAQTGPAGPRAALAVPAVAVAVGLVVLLLGRWAHVSTLATWLAAATLVAAAVRTQLAFRQLVRLHDAGRQARTDSLTGLGNRRALHEHLEQRLAHPGAELAVLLVDLDHFKDVNDTLGHHVGDELLRQVGPRVAPVLRPDDLLVRLGGDEFALVLPGHVTDGPEQVAVRLLERLAAPFELDGVVVRIGASVGVALCPEHATDANGLLQRADVAMYAAKAAGGGVRRYDPASDQHSRERLRTIEELRTALAGEQVVAHYQPQCDVATGRPTGVEALVRWQHPTRGLLSPDAFLTLVEQTGLMSALTTTVLGQAVRQCGQWRADGLDVRVSVNLSASSLLDEQLPAQVALLLARHDVPAAALTLELTENTLLTDPERSRQTLLRLGELGVRLSLDDYGTGYCSLSYLRHLPVHELKLDKVFLADLADGRNAAIVGSTVELAHALGLRLVAEGVEDDAGLALLRRLGCDTAQGYHLGRPQPADVVTAWLRRELSGALPFGAELLT